MAAAPDAPWRERGLIGHSGEAWLVGIALPLLTGVARSRRQEDALAACLATRRRGNRLLQIGVLLGRAPPAVRLHVLGLGADALLDYLIAVGWPGHSGDLHDTLTRLAPYGSPLVLRLSVGEAVEPRLGLEFRDPLPCLAGEREDRQSILDYLVQARLCAPAKRDALLDWPGSACLGSGRSGIGRAGMVVRSLRAIQINYRPGRPLEAVAHLSVSQERPYSEEAPAQPSAELRLGHPSDAGR